MKQAFRLISLFLRRQKASLGILLLLLILMVLSCLYRAGQVMYLHRANEALKRADIRRGYFLEMPYEHWRKGDMPLICEALEKTPGVRAVLCERRAALSVRRAVGSIGDLPVELFNPAQEAFFPLALSPSLADLRNVEAIAGEVLAFAPGSCALGAAGTVELRDGTSLTVRVVGNLQPDAFQLNFGGGGSAVSAAGFIGRAPHFYFWRDRQGLCINQKRYAGSVSASAIVVLDTGIDTHQEKVLRAWLSSQGTAFQSMEQVNAQSQDEMDRLLKRESVLPAFLFIVCSLFTVNLSVLRLRRGMNRLAVYRLTGLSYRHALLAFNATPFFLALFSWLLAFLAVLALRDVDWGNFFQRNRILINGPLLLSVLALELFITALAALVSWLLFRRMKPAELLRREDE